MDEWAYQLGHAIGYGAIRFIGFFRENPGMAGVGLAVLIGLLTVRVARFRGG